MQDFEKLGVFYLGKQYDLVTSKALDNLVLYDSKDLTTHAMIIGMTGSGKTGLGIGMIEEAAIDKIPVIAIDPKGDLGNLLLTFPNLSPQDFRPWVNQDDANQRGVSLDELAASTADMWRKGLAEWGQDGERIRRLRETVDIAIYTPGSSAGRPISVLQSFKAPGPAARDDGDLYRERIQATASSVLGLMGIEADPVTSREHVLLANIIQYAWNNGQDLDIGSLIRAIQQPPFQQIGVLDLESFYPSRDRSTLAMQLNTLLAAPGFEAWMQGEALDTARLLYTEAGQPRISIISIAHLSDRERMFFVSMLLNDVIGWMRAQTGTPSLRAMLYMDELFGYMPPVANPPSKQLLLTLLKQARAFGLGVVLSTQNPVDLDYKGLSNIGTWFVGRLQTERDKARVMEGLEGAAAGGAFDRQAMEQTLAGLGKRVFLMRNVHEDHPVVFTTRWVLSYLAGPLSRDQIRMLKGTPASAPQPAAASGMPQQAPASATPTAPATAAIQNDGPPVLPNDVPQYFLPARAGRDVVYVPMVIGAATVDFANTRYNVQETRKSVYLCPIDDAPVPVEWEQSSAADIATDQLRRSAVQGARYAEVPPAAARAKNYGDWSKALARWLRTSQQLTLYKSPALKAVSRPDETEGQFRSRLQLLAREQRDEQVEKLRTRYAARLETLHNRIRRAEQAVQAQQAQTRAAQLSTIAAVGQSVLGAFFGRKQSMSLSRAGSAIGRLTRESGDVGRAEGNVDALQRQLQNLEAELQQQIDQIDGAYDAQTERLEEVAVKPKSTDTHVAFVGLAWTPHERDSDGRLTPAWN